MSENRLVSIPQSQAGRYGMHVNWYDSSELTRPRGDQSDREVVANQR
jgi:hypothetical protein